VTLLAVDPGIRGCGVAVFEDGVLTSCSYVKNSSTTEGPVSIKAAKMALRVARDVFAKPDSLVLEWPQVYRESHRSKRKADPNDLLGLAAIHGALVAFFSNTTMVYEVLPSEWKPSGMKKDATAFRVASRLSPEEQKVLDSCNCPRSLIHNVVDAVGIGLHAVGRSLNPRGRRT
jgi:hypothetical protein